MKEKVAGAVLMLIMAAAMMTSVTFAWLTLSSNPEATGIDTTVVANGNLEIALSPEDGSVPGKSAAGDSSAAKGNSLTKANVTWGNLVNLSDQSYGLEKITLRPAALNGTSGLLNNPLYGVAYGEDGRITEMTTENDFAYAYYDTEKSELLVDLDNKHFGVRAVSTIQYKNLGGDAAWVELGAQVNRYLNTAKNNYANMTNESAEPGKSYIASLEGLIQVYAQSQINGDINSVAVTEYVENLYNMMADMDANVVDNMAESYLAMARMCLYSHDPNAEFTYTAETLCEAARNGKLNNYYTNYMPHLKEFADDRYQLKNVYLKKGTAEDFSDLTVSQKKSSLAYWAYLAGKGETVTWSDITNIIQWIVNTNTCTVDGYYMHQLKANITSLAGKFLTGQSFSAVIYDGVLKNMEQYIGQKMAASIQVKLDVSSYVPGMSNVKMKAVVSTDAKEPYAIPTDRDAVKALSNKGFKPTDATAQDTYALSVDLWLRTNGGTKAGDFQTVTDTTTDENNNEVTTVISPETAFLTLEGHVVTQEQVTQATIEDLNGDSQPAYTATVTYKVNGADATAKLDAFQRLGSYYILIAGSESTSATEQNAEEYVKANYGADATVTYEKKMDTTTVVVGYEGENRVWTEDQMVSYEGEGTSTTKGSGSCYIFYADTPADQARFLELLQAMKVVFIDSTGKQIGRANMDTEHAYAQNGKVTVPLVLDENQAVYLGKDQEGRDLYGLMEMEKNVAQRITALVYLDGTSLGNDNVLASGDIQGSLNIQFGSENVTKVVTTTKDPQGNVSESTSYTNGEDNLAIKDPSVMEEFIKVTASADKTSFESFSASNKPQIKLSATIGGVEPSKVEAQFTRAVSSTQGSLQDRFALTGSQSSWSGNYTFDKPGTYILRTLWVDGTEYELEEPVTITINGSAVSSLSCEAITDGSGRATILTADSSFSTKMHLGFSQSGDMPQKVNGIFMDEQGQQTTVAFTSTDGTSWTGTATFTSSGTYTMEYVQVDGELYEIKEAMQPTLELLLGLKVRTWVTCTKETLDALQTINDQASATSFTLREPVTLQVSAEIYDNKGNEITGLSGVTLNYAKDGSVIEKIDSTMTWDYATGRYQGNFLVDKAGSYQFKNMTVGTNVISRCTSAPGILAMPAESAYYYKNTTPEYQFNSDASGKVSIQVAYSSAVAKMEAKMTRTSDNKTITVTGTRGSEITTEEGISVNNWYFQPATETGQEGTWKLESIQMYGVYYEDVMYPAEGDGVTVALTEENIITKIVNNVYVTVQGNDQTLDTAYFMETQTAAGPVIQIADYEGMPLQAYDEATGEYKEVTLSDVLVKYYIETVSNPLDTYGYQVDGYESVVVEQTAKAKSGSTNSFETGNLSFQYAGNYKKCDISFSVNGTSFVGSNKKLIYKDNNGNAKDSYPAYTVRWIAPTITITGCEPEKGTSFDHDLVNGDGRLTYTVQNYYEDYYARLYTKDDKFILDVLGLNYYPTNPSLTLKLTNMGSNISSTNKAVFTLPQETSGQNDTTFTFIKDNSSSDSTKVGQINNKTEYMMDATVNALSVTYNSKTFQVKLSHEVTVLSKSTLPAHLEYNTTAYEEEYEEYKTALNSLDLTTKKGNQDGRTFTVTLPTMDNFTVTEVRQGDSGKTNTDESTKHIYYSKTFLFITTYYKYNRVTITKTTPSTKNTYSVVKKLTGWKVTKYALSGTAISSVSTTTYTPGQTLSISSGAYYKAEPVFGTVSERLTKTETKNYIYKTVQDSEEETSSSKPGTGYEKVSESDINTNLQVLQDGFEE